MPYKKKNIILIIMDLVIQRLTMINNIYYMKYNKINQMRRWMTIDKKGRKIKQIKMMERNYECIIVCNYS